MPLYRFSLTMVKLSGSSNSNLVSLSSLRRGGRRNWLEMNSCNRPNSSRFNVEILSTRHEANCSSQDDVFHTKLTAEAIETRLAHIRQNLETPSKIVHVAETSSPDVAEFTPNPDKTSMPDLGSIESAAVEVPVDEGPSQPSSLLAKPWDIRAQRRSDVPPNEEDATTIQLNSQVVTSNPVLVSKDRGIPPVGDALPTKMLPRVQSQECLGWACRVHKVVVLSCVDFRIIVGKVWPSSGGCFDIPQEFRSGLYFRSQLNLGANFIYRNLLSSLVGCTINIKTMGSMGGGYFKICIFGDIIVVDNSLFAFSVAHSMFELPQIASEGDILHNRHLKDPFLQNCGFVDSYMWSDSSSGRYSYR